MTRRTEREYDIVCFFFVENEGKGKRDTKANKCTQEMPGKCKYCGVVMIRSTQHPSQVCIDAVVLQLEASSSACSMF